MRSAALKERSPADSIPILKEQTNARLGGDDAVGATTGPTTSTAGDMNAATTGPAMAGGPTVGIRDYGRWDRNHAGGDDAGLDAPKAARSGAVFC